MLNREFDPYDLLQRLADQNKNLSKQLLDLTKAVEQHKNILEQLIEAHNQNVDLIKNLTVDTKELHDRQILLEVARQYENSKSN